MDIRNPFTLLRDISKKPPTVSSDLLKMGTLGKEEKDLIRRVGLSFGQLQQDIQADVNVTWDRQRYTTQIHRSLDHAIIAAAVRLYATSATSMSPIHNASVWITSKSAKYQKILSNLLDDIGIEEKIYDWAWSVAAFGDLFVEINGMPNLGIVSINDERNPIEVSRVEHEGILVGFYFTPIGYSSGGGKKIMEPWRFVHLRLLGAKRARPAWGDPSYSEFKTMSLMLGHNTRQATTRYGTSLVLDALPTYRRLRMAEDSLLLARMTRGILRYLYTMRVDACLTGDTKIELLNGRTPTIKEMADNPKKYIGKSTFSVDEGTGKLVPNKIKGVHRTRRDTQVVRVHLDSGEYESHVDCTPDHKFMLRNGEYKEAQDLLPNDSLMPLYSKIGHKAPMAAVHSPVVEWLEEKQDTYDIEMEGIPNFPLAAGVFVHNSNAEMLGELIDQIANTLKRARSINTSDTNPNFQSKESPFGVTEDLFLPIPGDPTTDFHVEELGGKPDIRWIVDIDELKQQLACALSTPLSLLGGYVDEASGSLGSEAIEKLDVGFARNSRRLQRALVNGIKRICQIHLAYQNLDPDPALFEVQMANPSTAEEESLRNSLETGTNTISIFMEMMETIDPNLDKKDIFNYLNQKILKLEDFDLNRFQKKSEELGEKKEVQEDKDAFVRYPIENMDLITYLPLQRRLVEGKEVTALSERAASLFHGRWSDDWTKSFAEARIVEFSEGEKPGHQMTIADEIERKKVEQEVRDILDPV